MVEQLSVVRAFGGNGSSTSKHVADGRRSRPNLRSNVRERAARRRTRHESSVGEHQRRPAARSKRIAAVIRNRATIVRGSPSF